MAQSFQWKEAAPHGALDMITIDKDKIPLPPYQSAKNMKYPWNELKLHGSFFVEAGGNLLLRWQRVRGAVRAQNRSSPTPQFTARLDHEHNGIRVWRIK